MKFSNYLKKVHFITKSNPDGCLVRIDDGVVVNTAVIAKSNGGIVVVTICAAVSHAFEDVDRF